MLCLPNAIECLTLLTRADQKGSGQRNGKEFFPLPLFVNGFNENGLQENDTKIFVVAPELLLRALFYTVVVDYVLDTPELKTCLP